MKHSGICDVYRNIWPNILAFRIFYNKFQHNSRTFEDNQQQNQNQEYSMVLRILKHCTQEDVLSYFKHQERVSFIFINYCSW